jgi:hypothetical protein
MGRPGSGGHDERNGDQPPDWLRAHAGWPEAALTCACSLAAEAVGDQGPVGATIALDGPTVHLHVERCGDLQRVADADPGQVTVAAHGGDIVLRSLGDL